MSFIQTVINYQNDKNKKLISIIKTNFFNFLGLVAATAGGIQVYMLPGVSDTFWALMEWNRQVGHDLDVRDFDVVIIAYLYQNVGLKKILNTVAD